MLLKKTSPSVLCVMKTGDLSRSFFQYQPAYKDKYVTSITVTQHFLILLLKQNNNTVTTD